MKSAILGQVVETPLEYDYLLCLLDCKLVSALKSLSGYGACTLFFYQPLGNLIPIAILDQRSHAQVDNPHC